MADRPHVVRIDCHDAGQHVGPYGIETVHTPALDRLAAEGVRVADSFCAAPQCSPSRASMVTGRYPHQNGVMGITQSKAWDLHDDEDHIAELFAAAGYDTALAGFAHEARDPGSFFERDREGAGGDDAVTAAREFLADRDAADDPFYLQVGIFDPHRRPDLPANFSPLPDPTDTEATVPEYLRDDPEAREAFVAFEGAVRAMDRRLGEVLDAIDAAGIAEETIVVATTDHGIPFPRAKGSPYDPGIETFLLFRWPDRLPAGETYPGPVSTVDHLPTLLDFAGLPIPDRIEGVSHAAPLAAPGGVEEAPRDAVYAELTYHTYPDPRRAIRTGRYKLIANFAHAPFFMDTSSEWRPSTITVDPEDPSTARHPPLELYDVDADPLETDNLADDPEQADTRRELLDRLRGWMARTDDPLLAGHLPAPPVHGAVLDALETGDLPDREDWYTVGQKQ